MTNKQFKIFALKIAIIAWSLISISYFYYSNKNFISISETESTNSLNKTIKVIHPYWSDSFVFSDNGKKVKRTKSTHTATVSLFIPNEKIVVKWENMGDETFLYNSEIDTYIFYPEKHVKLFYNDFPNAKDSGEIIDVTQNTVLFKDKKGLKRFLYKNQKFELVQESNVSYTEPKKIAILYISTGKYIVFWKNFYQSMEKHFLPKHKKTYFLFTNHSDLSVPNNVVKIYQEQLPWPYITMKRFHFFDKIKDQLKDFDYIYFLNGDAQPVRDINEEIFPTKEQEIMVTLHSWYYLCDNNSYSYDRNQLSQSFIPYDSGKFYVTGAFNGGTADGFLKMTSILKDWVDIDINNNVIPLWHDESMLNKYLLTYFFNKNPLILFPEYVITEGNNYDAVKEFPLYKMMLINKDEYGGREYLRSIN